MKKRTCWQDEPPSLFLRDSAEQRIYAFLKRLSVPFRGIDHEPIGTMEAAKGLEDKLNAEICKNLFLTDRDNHTFCLFMLPKEKRFRAHELVQETGLPPLHFASPDQMQELLGIRPGAVTVMGLLQDRQKKVRLLMDRDLLKASWIGCHPGVNTTTIAIRTSDLVERILPALEHFPIFVSLKEENR
jgi:Ala-tRNA(Pro) deacylase